MRRQVKLALQLAKKLDREPLELEEAKEEARGRNEGDLHEKGLLIEWQLTFQIISYNYMYMLCICDMIYKDRHSGIMERDASLHRFIAEIGWVYSNRAEWCHEKAYLIPIYVLLSIR